jgi:hypothetical protein
MVGRSSVPAHASSANHQLHILSDGADFPQLFLTGHARPADQEEPTS